MAKGGIGTQHLHLVRVAQQADQAIADEVGGGLEPGREQQHDRGDQLVLGQSVSAITDPDQPADQIVGMPIPPLGDQRPKVVAHRVARGLGGGDRLGARHRLECTGRVTHDPPELLTVLDGNTEEFADHSHGQRERKRVHDIAAATVGELIEDLIDHRLDSWTQLLDPSGGEFAGDETSHSGVIGWVHPQHRVPRDDRHLPFGARADDPKMRCTSSLLPNRGSRSTVPQSS